MEVGCDCLLQGVGCRVLVLRMFQAQGAGTPDVEVRDCRITVCSRFYKAHGSRTQRALLPSRHAGVRLVCAASSGTGGGQEGSAARMGRLVTSALSR